MALRSNLINGGVAEATVTVSHVFTIPEHTSSRPDSIRSVCLFLWVTSCSDLEKLLSQDATALVDQQTRGQPTQPPAYEGEDRNTSTDIDAVDITLKNSTLWNPEAHFSPAQQQGDNHYSNGLRADSFNETPEWADANAEERLLEYFNDGHALGSHFNGTFDHSSQLQSSYRPRYPRMCKRTIVLSGVPDNTNLEDVTRVIRGGMLLEVFIRAADHSALVSFLHEDDAVHFYEHSRKYDLYINHKRVSFHEHLDSFKLSIDAVPIRSSSSGPIATSLLLVMLPERLPKELPEI